MRPSRECGRHTEPAQNNKARFDTDLLHTNTDIDGVREEAEDLGYGGGLSMSFLRLSGVVFPIGGHPAVIDIGTVPYALSKANESQSEILDDMIHV